MQKTAVTVDFEGFFRPSPPFLRPIRLMIFFIKRLSFRSRRKKSEANRTRELDFLAINSWNIALPCAHTPSEFNGNRAVYSQKIGFRGRIFFGFFPMAPERRSLDRNHHQPDRPQDPRRRPQKKHQNYQLARFFWFGIHIVLVQQISWLSCTTAVINVG